MSNGQMTEYDLLTDANQQTSGNLTPNWLWVEEEPNWIEFTSGIMQIDHDHVCEAAIQATNMVEYNKWKKDLPISIIICKWS